MNSQMSDLQLDIRDGLATFTFDRPDSKVNILASTVMLRLDELLDRVEQGMARGEVRALLVRSGKRNNFIAGADIDELARMESAAEATEMSRGGQAILQRLDRLRIPTIVAISGPCLGGGLELALACDYRVASDHPSTRLGLPETRLGILPGMGGTVRLPRLVGLQAALDLILSARLIDAERARKIGLVDRVLDAESFEKEIEDLGAQFARSGRLPLKKRRRTLIRMLADGPVGRPIVKRITRRAVLKRTRGHYPALPLALEVTVNGLGLSMERAQEREAEAFGRLAVTPECKSLFFVYKITEGARKRAPEGVPETVKRAAVVGAGVMGAGIAELFAYQNIPVRIVDLDDERVHAGVDRARELLEKAAKRSGWSDEERGERMGRLKGATGYDGFEKVDIVVEAVIERANVKRLVFSNLEEHVRSTAVIATNTSALSVSDLQRGLEQPGRVCGLHFFNPPHRMPLVEVVRGAQTSDGALATAFQLAARLGKTPIVVKDAPGFVVNRILAAYLTEAGHLLQSGMEVDRTDRVMERFGMPVGPLRLLDEIGLDVVAEVSRTMEDAFGDRFAPAPIIGAVLATGVTGRKGGRGFYLYEDGNPKRVDSEIAAILGETARSQPPADAEAEERMVFTMINEAARILDDEIVDTPESLDVAMIMGTGFPPFRGGLLRYADSLGLDRVAQRLRHYSSSIGPRFEPAPGLLERKTFYTA